MGVGGSGAVTAGVMGAVTTGVMCTATVGIMGAALESAECVVLMPFCEAWCTSFGPPLQFMIRENDLGSSMQLAYIILSQKQQQQQQRSESRL